MIVIYSFTEKGRELAGRLKNILDNKRDDKRDNKRDNKRAGESARDDFSLFKTGGVQSFYQSVATLEQYMVHGNLLIFIGASGIAVRSIAPYLKGKEKDAAVLVADEKGQFIISLLSGHLGGANACCKSLACLLGATPVITTATDVWQLWAVDEFARKNHYYLYPLQAVCRVSAKVLKGETVYCFGEQEKTMKCLLEDSRGCCVRTCDRQKADIVVLDWEEYKTLENCEDKLFLLPKDLCLGLGCKKGKDGAAISRFVRQTFAREKIDIERIQELHTIDLKKEEQGIFDFAAELGVPVFFHTAEELRKVPGQFSASLFVQEKTGVDNVCERSAAVMGGKLILSKTSDNGITLACAKYR